MDTPNSTKESKVDKESLKKSIRAKKKAMDGKKPIYKESCLS